MTVGIIYRSRSYTEIDTSSSYTVNRDEAGVVTKWVDIIRLLAGCGGPGELFGAPRFRSIGAPGPHKNILRTTSRPAVVMGHSGNYGQ
jgi:hypothetical protein